MGPRMGGMMCCRIQNPVRFPNHNIYSSLIGTISIPHSTNPSLIPETLWQYRSSHELFRYSISQKSRCLSWLLDKLVIWFNPRRDSDSHPTRWWASSHVPGSFYHSCRNMFLENCLFCITSQIIFRNLQGRHLPSTPSYSTNRCQYYIRTTELPSNELGLAKT